MRLGDVELTGTNKAFLAGFIRLMRSMLLWSSNHGPDWRTEAEVLTERETAKVDCLETLMVCLREDLNSCIISAVTEMKTAVQYKLLEPISVMCSAASPKLPAIALGWPLQGHDGRPMRWATFRSICINK